MKKNWYYLILIFVVCFNFSGLYAQNTHHTKIRDFKSDTALISQSAMSSGFSRNLPMNRDGSGTSWLPDAAPMTGIMFGGSNWMLMAHYSIFLRYTNQDVFRTGGRGGAHWDAPNMGMLMGQHPVGKNGLFYFGIMVSLDPLTVGGEGYPLLFQNGESWKGIPLVDRQHPHDLFSEVSISYSRELSKNADLFLYLGYPGEPALGPVTYMHRPSGREGPDAPIGHHWQDATHITFGVATLGLRVHNFKIEGSLFTGREPNENRYNFDKPRLDSYSGRFSYNPSKNWAVQVSRGFIKSPEATRPEEDITRTTASVNYAKEWARGKYFNANLVWGQNKGLYIPTSGSLGLEASIDLPSFSIYSRWEWVDKSVEELNLFPNSFLAYLPVIPHNVYSFSTVLLGFNQKIIQVGQTKISLGAQASLNFTPSGLTSLYGKYPFGTEVFLKISPSIIKMRSMGEKMDKKMDKRMIM